jgi:hypothetical protein
MTAINGSNHTKNPKTIKLRGMMDRNKKQITLLWVPGHMGIPGNEQADEEAKAALDVNIQQNEEYPPKDLEKWLKTETTKIRKERWRNGSNHMKGRKIEHGYDGDTRHDEKGTGGNLQTENEIYESYPWTTNERNHRPTVPFLRHRTYSRPRLMGLHRN